LDDAAAAAARVLTEPGHVGATYEVVGTPGLTQTQVADELGRALGRAVRAQAEPVAAWAQRARAASLGDYAIATLLAMFHYYARYGLWGSPNTLTWLLGRPPTTYAQFAARMTAELPT
jgi:NAD(P)H dehydrogenase (quinone)